MKIVNIKEFRELPEGTLFAKYEQGCFEDIRIKGETWTCDFMSSDIVGAIDHEGSDDHHQKLQLAEETGISLCMNFDDVSRDGCFDDDQLFAVYEKQDVKMLIDKLTQCMKVV